MKKLLIVGYDCAASVGTMNAQTSQSETDAVEEGGTGPTSRRLWAMLHALPLLSIALRT